MKLRILAVSCFILWGCQNYSENSLGTDMTLQAKCPANGCANHAPSSNELEISTAARNIQLAPTDGSVQIGGQCYASTYPNNVIYVSVYDPNSQPINPGAIAVGYSTGLRCVRGRFDLALNAFALAYGVTYRVRLELEAYDQNGKPFRGPAGSTEISVYRHAPPAQ